MNPGEKHIHLVVNADDFGLNKEVNAGIIKAFTDGVVTSASLLVDQEGYTDALLHTQKHPTLDIGIHLNVFRGKPLTKPRYLVNKEGVFYGETFRFLFVYLLHKKHILQEIQNEFKAQIARVQKDGITITHLDTEKHVHTLPAIFSIVLKLAEENGKLRVRLPFEKISISSFKNPSQFPKLLFMLFCHDKNQRILKKALGITPDFLHGVSLSKQYSLERITSWIHSLSGGTHELSCHPGLEPKKENSYIDTYRAQELAVLTNPAIKHSIRERGVSLIPYRNIGTI